jgi:hypothetical protein
MRASLESSRWQRNHVLPGPPPICLSETGRVRAAEGDGDLALEEQPPARYPREASAGKSCGLAVPMSLSIYHEHYPKHHCPPAECSPLARRFYDVIRLDLISTCSLREEVGLGGRAGRSKFDRAQELRSRQHRPPKQFAG